MIGRASKRRRLALFVVLCLAFFLAVLVSHSVGHDIDESATLTCAVVVLLAMGARAAPKPAAVRVRFEPVWWAQLRPVVVPGPRATESPPGFTPLRL